MSNVVSIDPFRIGKAYSVAEAARLAKTTPQTVRRWLVGYDAPGHHMEPVFREARDPHINLQVSFLQLVEIAVVGGWRSHKVNLDRIRRAHGFACNEVGVPYPFATMDFKILGGHIIHAYEVKEPSRQTGMVAFDTAAEQWVLPNFIMDEMQALDFETEDKFAARWYPFGRDAKVLIDPHLSAGRPVIEGTRIPISAIQARFDAGDSIRFLARDYGLTASVVEEVIRLAKAA